jgi:hypothetical protein
VGETLREVFLNEAAFTVPVDCLAAAGRKIEPHMVWSSAVDDRVRIV